MTPSLASPDPRPHRRTSRYGHVAALRLAVRTAVALGIVFALSLQQVDAANKYFDANGVTAGGGDPCNANISGGANWSSSDAGTDPQHAAGKLEVKNVRGRTVWLHLVTGQVTATRTPGPPPLPPHWVVEIDGTTYLDPISWDVGDVDAVTVRPRVELWSDDHLEAFR